jgi:hypothetical protein
LSHYQKHFPCWSFTATRKKVIADYWFRHVLQHFAFVMVVALVISICLSSRAHYLLLPLFFSTAISFLTAVAFNYWPAYYSDFLTKLDTIIAEKEKIISVADELKKCKRPQFLFQRSPLFFMSFLKPAICPCLHAMIIRQNY